MAGNKTGNKFVFKNDSTSIHAGFKASFERSHFLLLGFTRMHTASNLVADELFTPNIAILFMATSYLSTWDSAVFSQSLAHLLQCKSANLIGMKPAWQAIGLPDNTYGTSLACLADLR